MKIRNLAFALAASVMSVGAFAQVPVGMMPGQFDHHEGRMEIEHRLHHQGERIFFKLRAGLITPGQATVLRGEDDRVREEMHAMEVRHGGFLTPEDKMALNHHLDEISRQIGA
jgi:hypothetical protein